MDYSDVTNATCTTELRKETIWKCSNVRAFSWEALEISGSLNCDVTLSFHLWRATSKIWNYLSIIEILILKQQLLVDVGLREIRPTPRVPSRRCANFMEMRRRCWCGAYFTKSLIQLRSSEKDFSLWHVVEDHIEIVFKSFLRQLED